MNGPRVRNSGLLSPTPLDGFVSEQARRRTAYNAATNAATNRLKVRLKPLLMNLPSRNVKLLDDKSVKGIVQKFLHPKNEMNAYISEKICESSGYREAVHGLMDGLNSLLANMPEGDFIILDQIEIINSIAEHVICVIGKDIFFKSSSDRTLTSTDLKNALSPAEVNAIAAILGQTGDDLTAALEHVRNLQRRGLPISLPEQVRDENRYVHRPDKTESIVSFLRRVWGPEIEAGLLTRPYLRKHDPSTNEAIGNWLRQKPLPPDIKLPILKELNDTKLGNKQSLREGMRLASAHARRSIQS